jgi:pyruvate carboxylase
MHISPREVNAALKKQVSGSPKDVAKKQLIRHRYTDFRRVPVKRLMGKLNILNYDTVPSVSMEEKSCKEAGFYLRQHIGAPALSLVKPGDTVEKGQCIAAIPEKALGANIHASISGKVKAVDENLIFLVKE